MERMARRRSGRWVHGGEDVREDRADGVAVVVEDPVGGVVGDSGGGR